jgi:hypothetical protein
MSKFVSSGNNDFGTFHCSFYYLLRSEIRFGFQIVGVLFGNTIMFNVIQQELGKQKIYNNFLFCHYLLAIVHNKHLKMYDWIEPPAKKKWVGTENMQK